MHFSQPPHLRHCRRRQEAAHVPVSSQSPAAAYLKPGHAAPSMWERALQETAGSFWVFLKLYLPGQPQESEPKIHLTPGLLSPTPLPGSEVESHLEQTAFFRSGHLNPPCWFLLSAPFLNCAALLPHCPICLLVSVCVCVCVCVHPP